ncbi:glycine zipper family protein [Exilibacterium tricleocarpae]|uniref:Glycine zipper family protein n=1 Tax=Exilibacterium tricleocarpae TaxID=2591008 RepID=A0A545T879_9GAMM|nr:DUF6515 family protein [Exilibacterium tricleocarpae]TQV73434.1 glycine zipper family protein [Exilibacterium tricleocarpae]
MLQNLTLHYQRFKSIHSAVVPALCLTLAIGAVGCAHADRNHNQVKPRPVIPKHHYPPRGQIVKALPKNHTRLRVGTHLYFHLGGVFYRSGTKGYTVVAAPVGARVSALPRGFVTLHIGPRVVYKANAAYYHYDADNREYVVVENPETEVASDDNELMIYPKNNQSEEQLDRDRYECHRWTVSVTGFDPSLPDQEQAKRSHYNRAISACLDGRGYAVR